MVKQSHNPWTFNRLNTKHTVEGMLELSIYNSSSPLNSGGPNTSKLESKLEFELLFFPFVNNSFKEYIWMVKSRRELTLIKLF